jgi:uncharacterized protein YbaP (TraB family)
MRIIKHLTACAAAAIAFAAIPACAQTAPAPKAAATDADPALWVVKDADTTVYLFGTVHVLKPGLTWFDEAVKTAFDKSDTLVLEIQMPEPSVAQQLFLSKGMNPTGPTLTEQLPADKRAAVTKALTDAGLPPQAYDRMKPWLAAIVATQAPLQKLGYEMNNGPEKVLTEAAKTGGKKVDALETVEQQLGFFDALPTPAQITFLTAGVEQLPQLPKLMGDMVDVWAKGDPQGLAKIMNDTLDDSPELAKALLTDRNKTWASWIGKRMEQPGTVFVAVGAGHLAGADAVQEQLKAYKLTATRVKY